MSKITYALPAFADQLTADDRNRINAISRKALRRGVTHTAFDIEEIIDNFDRKIFYTIHSLLKPLHTVLSLRKRKHYYQLPDVEFSQYKNCFINRCLFKFRWLFSVCFVLFFNVLCVFIAVEAHLHFIVSNSVRLTCCIKRLLDLTWSCIHKCNECIHSPSSVRPSTVLGPTLAYEQRDKLIMLGHTSTEWIIGRYSTPTLCWEIGDKTRSWNNCFVQLFKQRTERVLGLNHAVVI